MLFLFLFVRISMLYSCQLTLWLRPIQAFIASLHFVVHHTGNLITLPGPFSLYIADIAFYQVLGLRLMSICPLKVL